ncbi:MAG: hypothetical protein ACRC5V_11905 [Aeromonas sp.]
MTIKLGFTVLLGGVLGGCALLPQPVPPPAPPKPPVPQVQPLPKKCPAPKVLVRLLPAYKALQDRLQYADWLITSTQKDRAKERRRVQGSNKLASRISLAMLDAHPDEAILKRRAGLARLKKILPKLDLDMRVFLRNWVEQSDLLLAHDDRSQNQSQEIHRLRHQIERLSVIDEQLNQRKRYENQEMTP